MSVAPVSARSPTAPVIVFSPRGLRAYLVHPDHVLLALLVIAAGVYLRDWVALGEGLAAVAVGSLLLAWLGEMNGRRQHGMAWQAYRQQVGWWWPRWKPWHRSALEGGTPVARVYFAESCLTCSAVAGWVKARGPVGLEIHAAEDHPRWTLSRMSFDAMDGSAEVGGLPAFGRVLQHLNLGYALVGSLMQLPIVRWVLQVVVDAIGGGPRVIPRRGEHPTQ